MDAPQRPLSRAGAVRRARRWLTAVAVLIGLLAGCTYSDREPGLFRTAPPTPTATTEPASPPPPSPPPLEPPDPSLPVAAESVVTSGEGLHVTTRFAVHAVRRMPGATVLDWSVTPLSAPGLARGDYLPTWVDLGLTRESEASVNVFLIDPGSGQVFRPLHHRQRSQFHRCLCSPLWLAQLSLRIGETRLLQVAYPELPASLSTVGVDLANSLPFWGVPVTPVGQVPTSLGLTDLTRPAGPAPHLARMRTFVTFPGSFRRRQGITIDRVVRGPEMTSVRWTLTSVTDQPSLLSYGPPVAAELPGGVPVMDTATASGPQLRAGRDRRVLHSRFVTVRRQSPGFFECLCTDLGLWAASLRQAGGQVSLITNFPALPSVATRVDVVLPTVGVIPGVPVEPAPPSGGTLGPPEPAVGNSWRYLVDRPPRGWTSREWPTPLPATDQLPDYEGTVDKLVTLPGW